MIMELYCVKDVKSGYMNPFPMQNRGVALREFAASVMSRQGIFEKYPEDMEFWQIAEYDNDSGVITPKLEFVVSARDFLKE